MIRKKGSDTEYFIIRNSLRAKLLKYILLPFMALYVSAIAINYHTHKEDKMLKMRDYLKALTMHYAEIINNRFNSIESEAKGISEFIGSFSDLSDRELFSMVRMRMDLNKNILGLGIAYKPFKHSPEKPLYAPYFYRVGDDIVSYNLADRYNYLLKEWYLIPSLLRRSYWTEPYFGELTGSNYIVSYIHPVKERDEITAFAVVDWAFEGMLEELDDIRIMAGYVTIVNRAGTIIYHPNIDYIFNESIFSLAQHFGDDHFRRIGRDIIKGEAGFAFFFDMETAEKKWLFHTPIKSCGWSFIAVVPESEIMLAFHRDMVQISLIFIAGMVTLIVILLIVSYHITAPVKRFTFLAEEVSAGKLNTGIEISSKFYEISKLGSILNNMTMNIKNSIDDTMNVVREKEAFETDFRVAKRIQENLLPKDYSKYSINYNIDISSVYMPSKLVGGDYFDLFQIDKDRIFVIMSDVSGKGTFASFYMVMLKSALTGILRDDSDTAIIIQRLNKFLKDNLPGGVFVTALCGTLDLKKMQFSFARAGHCPLLLYSSKTDNTCLLNPRGMPLGIVKNLSMHLETTLISIGPGDLLLIWTDGVSEAMDKNKCLLGEEKIIEIVSKTKNRNIKDIIGTICIAIQDFSVDMPQSDDIAILGIRIN